MALCRQNADCESAGLARRAAWEILGLTYTPQGRKVCAPDGMSDHVLAGMLTAYLARHPEQLDDPEETVFRKAVQEAWPCPKTPKTFEVLGCRAGVCGAVRADGSIDPRP